MSQTMDLTLTKKLVPASKKFLSFSMDDSKSQHSIEHSH